MISFGKTFTHDDADFDKFAESVGMNTERMNGDKGSHYYGVTQFARFAWIFRQMLGKVHDERGMFEQLAMSKRHGTFRPPCANGAYSNPNTRCGWLAWQASAAMYQE